MHTRRTFVTMMLAGLACGAPAVAQPGTASALAERLSNDLDPALVPPGYQFIISQPAAISDNDAAQKVAACVNLLFEKTAAAGGRSGDSVKESIYFYIFDSPAQAAAFEPDWDDTMATFEAQMRTRSLDKRSRRLERRVEVKSATGTVALRCRVMDGFVNCLAPHAGSAVVIDLVLQEPELNAAADDEKRTAVLAARLRREADGLLKAAQMHLASALRATR